MRILADVLLFAFCTARAAAARNRVANSAALCRWHASKSMAVFAHNVSASAQVLFGRADVAASLRCML